MKKQRLAISGVLLFDKSRGLSSNFALQHVKRLFNAQKTGHTGTLDPLASGLLPLMFGEATKFANDLIQASKTYEATVRLGYSSTTGDAEGELEEDSKRLQVIENLGENHILEVFSHMKGSMEQTPPMYSALKKEGKPLYEYARQGVEVERQARTIQLFQLNLLAFEKSGTEASISFEAECSKGTYIRTLGEDIAKALGTRGYLTALRRTKIGDLDVKEALTLEALQALHEKAGQFSLEQSLIEVDSLLTHLQAITLDQDSGRRFLHGQRLPLELTGQPAGRVRVYANLGTEPAAGKTAVFLGTGTLETHGKGGLLRPERLIQVNL
nr:tRNA pseudouridine(55) synthase TruB [Limnobacter litoralis]